MTIINTTLEDIQRAFTVWDARYRANPEAFMNEAARLLSWKEDEYTYGEACAPYFVSILESLS